MVGRCSWNSSSLASIRRLSPQNNFKVRYLSPHRISTCSMTTHRPALARGDLWWRISVSPMEYRSNLWRSGGLTWSYMGSRQAWRRTLSCSLYRRRTWIAMIPRQLMSFFTVSYLFTRRLSLQGGISSSPLRKPCASWPSIAISTYITQFWMRS